ncbi:hypothetical protein [Kaistella palustris]|uniref:hypothetical protein n=1 Tax=Kaistella palustris TaxID=493376 RepID=UPI0003F5FF78|nr:hypothetical protein [Kaistella palustris]
MKKLLAITALFVSLSFSAQQDYEWLKLNPFQTAVFGDTLVENSGLEFIRGKLYTFNDSGNTSEIFEIDKHSAVIKKVFKTNLKNQDWEAIASDSTSLYIGDIGNNRGTRKDLVIYKIPFNDSLDLTSIKEIPFYYPEQTSFEPQNLNNDFDAESMIFLNGKIHVFTKEWFSKGVTHYTVNPNLPEKQAAQIVENYKTDFVVTDASYFKGRLYLVGYTKKFEIYLSVFNETSPGIFFDQKPKKYFLGSTLAVGQIEGIAVDESGAYISGEEFRSPLGRSKARLYFIPAEKLK